MHYCAIHEISSRVDFGLVHFNSRPFINDNDTAIIALEYRFKQLEWAFLESGRLTLKCHSLQKSEN